MPWTNVSNVQAQGRAACDTSLWNGKLGYIASLKTYSTVGIDSWLIASATKCNSGCNFAFGAAFKLNIKNLLAISSDGGASKGEATTHAIEIPVPRYGAETNGVIGVLDPTRFSN